MSEVIVDQFGNVQIPGVILTRLGLEPGQRLIIETDEEGAIRLSPVSEEGNEAIVSAHSLAEVYPVLTRMPRPLQVSTAVALQLIERNILNYTESYRPDC